MSVTVTELSGFERRLTLRFEGQALQDAENRAARRISHEVHINGFRRGRAPRRMVERVVGKDQIRQEALQEMLEGRLLDALEEARLALAAPPEVEEVRNEAAGVEVDVRVALWPALDKPPEYEGRRFELDGPSEVDPEEVQRQLELHLEDFAELETVDRPALDGDYAVLGIDSRSEGRALAAFSADDLLYEVGSDGLLDGLDDSLAGCSAGDEVDFTSRLRRAAGGLEAGAPVAVRVEVKEVKEKRLPDIDDEWAADFTEFETVKEMEQDIYRWLEEIRLAGLRRQLRDKVLSELLEEIDAVIPAAVIGAEVDRILDGVRRRYEEQGADVDRYLNKTGRDREEYLLQVDEAAARRVRTEVLLDAVAAHAGLGVEEWELYPLYERAAIEAGQTAEEMKQRMAGGLYVTAVADDILKQKALDALLRAVTPVDRDGNVIDLGIDEPDAEDAAGPPEETVQAVVAPEGAAASDAVVQAVVEPELPLR